MTSSIAAGDGAHGMPAPTQSMVLDLPGDGVRLDAAFAAAENQHGAVVERWFHLGGATVRMRFAGTALVGQVTRAFSHLAAPLRPASDRAENIDLDVAIWDSHTTGIGLPSLSWLAGREDSLGPGRGFDQGPYRGTFNTGEILGVNHHGIRGALSTGDGLLQVFDGQRRQGTMWIDRADRYPSYESAAPLRRILHWWAQSDGAQLTHAAAVGTREFGAVLVVGASGSGKSTTALACLGSPLKFLGDDYVLLRRAHGPMVYSLYGTGKVEPHHLPRLDHLKVDVVNSERLAEEKAVLQLADRHASQLIDSLPVRCIVVPRIVPDGKTCLLPLSRAAAFRAVAPSTVFQSPGAGTADFRFLADFVRDLPCHQLQLGADIDSVPRVLSALLETP